MSGEKTEKATPKKRRDAREKGQVRKSTEVVTALMMLALFFLLKTAWGWLVGQGKLLFTKLLSTEYIIPGSVSPMADNGLSMIHAGAYALTQMALMCAPIFLGAVIVGVFANVIQVGFFVSTKAMQPKFSRISPIQGFKRIFSTRTLAELVKSLLKVTALGVVLKNEYTKYMSTFPQMMELDVVSAAIDLMDICFTIALKMSFVLAVIALIDYIFQWWQYEKDLRMSKQEIKDEYKLMEGNPQIKGAIKQKQRQMSAMRMMAAVPEADVVITNPTHYAIALRYDLKRDQAPTVIAKGKDFVAQKIKEVARANFVEMVENRPLAQSLYVQCEIGQEIPEEFYQAIAEILVYLQKYKSPFSGNRPTAGGEAGL